MHKETLQESLHLYAVNSIYITALTQALGFQKTIFYIKVNNVAQIFCYFKGNVPSLSQKKNPYKPDGIASKDILTKSMTISSFLCLAGRTNQRKYRINPPKVHKVGKSEIFKQIDKEINTKVQDNLIWTNMCYIQLFIVLFGS